MIRNALASSVPELGPFFTVTLVGLICAEMWLSGPGLGPVLQTAVIMGGPSDYSGKPVRRNPGD